MGHDITRLLNDLAAGDRVDDALLPRVYDELRALAAAHLASERRGHTLQPTALVHEAYVRLLGPDGSLLPWHNRAHFFAAAANAMRRILIDHARARNALKRGGDPSSPRPSPLPHTHPHRWLNTPLDAAFSPDADPDLILDLDDALAALAAHDPPKARLVMLRFFAGLTLEQAANALGISAPTADRHWAFAKAWLLARLTRDPNPPHNPHSP